MHVATRMFRASPQSVSCLLPAMLAAICGLRCGGESGRSEDGGRMGTDAPSTKHDARADSRERPDSATDSQTDAGRDAKSRPQDAGKDVTSKPVDAGKDATLASDASDANGDDAGAIVDAGPSDALFWQWWYPDCGVAAGQACTTSGCGSVPLQVGPADFCGAEQISAGCSNNGLTDGVSCYLSLSDNRYIFTQAHPYTMDGLTFCSDASENILPACEADGGEVGDSGLDASPEGDAGIPDADVPDVAFWQWWYPECGAAPGDPCTDPSCQPFYPDIGTASYCNTGMRATVGCLPRSTEFENSCYVSAAYDRYVSDVPKPYTTQGLSPCEEDGVAVGGEGQPPVHCESDAGTDAP